jgi:hypothetical protein
MIQRCGQQHLGHIVIIGQRRLGVDHQAPFADLRRVKIGERIPKTIGIKIPRTSVLASVISPCVLKRHSRRWMGGACP